jgi:hypothetical protein
MQTIPATSRWTTGKKAAGAAPSGDKKKKLKNAPDALWRSGLAN